jgi:predicted transcriptional regulator
LLNIAQLRNPVGVSQAELSLRSGINRFRLSQLECGYAEPTADEQTALLAALLDIVKQRTSNFYRMLQGVK